MSPQVQPLSYRHRFLFFYLLLGIFVLSLPFLFLYATGYRLSSIGIGGNLVSTGGIYVATERSGAQIFIDDELVRETRIFRRAFYAQGLDAMTHKVYVQKADHHTWVKELPVYPHIVTEAQAFNLPLVPKVRLITKWQTQAGVAVLTSTSDILDGASSTNQILFEPRASTTTLVMNQEYAQLLKEFESPEVKEESVLDRARSNLTGESATSTATTTKEWRGVRLYQQDDEVYASFIGNREEMPYYYCAEDFPRWEGATATSTASTKRNLALAYGTLEKTAETNELDLPVQEIPDEVTCDPVILIDNKGEAISHFDFFPNSVDLVIIATKSGIYVTEIDDRSWQNRQPLLLGKDLSFRVIGSSVYAYDGKVIYQINISQNWF
ncbi:hypothetical protein A2392_01385 [Candidatus Kaiserbacteria bacterium RIFOXYB1_FULL_46_14]|uniref:PEGA domain-containing protein n=1 Tax=Candidatus Kaiserbacteria bacterium RIFOXYB1_FULL_46_14 TaxID=1798531 RepID=A0A1F6FJR5_9BACT|nr:MAG: hypothetical protein A2392_01385 [Candidatus Kaiserbacteria bacterium RIFOXYB1_FULL_46_14]